MDPTETGIVEQNFAPQTPAVAESGSRLLTTAEQETFESLSMEVFGASSRWATILKKGLSQAVTQKVMETVPATETEPEKAREVDAIVYLDKNKKSAKMTKRYFTPETLMAYMLERKKQIDAIKAMIAEQQSKAKAAKEQEALSKHVAQNVSGAAT